MRLLARACCWVLILSAIGSEVRAEFQEAFDQTFEFFGLLLPLIDPNTSLPIPNQAATRASASIVHEFTGEFETVNDAIINCVVPVEPVCGEPGIVSLSSDLSHGGLNAQRLIDAGDDRAFVQSRVVGTGSVTNTVGDNALISAFASGTDAQAVTFIVPPGVPAPATIDVDMTYSLAVSLVADSIPPFSFGPGLSAASAQAAVSVLDVSTFLPSGPPGAGSIFLPYSAIASVVIFNPDLTPGTLFEEKVIARTVTLSIPPNTPHWIILNGLIGFLQLTQLGENDLGGIDIDQTTFADPVFAINPDWAAANPDVADQIVIERILNSTPIDVDIRPFFAANLVNVHSQGLIPVAILSNGDVYAEDVDAGSLRFGPLQAESRHRPRPRLIDVDWDGDRDLLVYFLTSETGIACGDTDARLIGLTTGGVHIAGMDAVVPVPCRP